MHTVEVPVFGDPVEHLVRAARGLGPIPQDVRFFQDIDFDVCKKKIMGDVSAPALSEVPSKKAGSNPQGRES